eukprot:1123479-Ditylum_brightwellii.AAC.1
MAPRTTYTHSTEAVTPWHITTLTSPAILTVTAIVHTKAPISIVQAETATTATKTEKIQQRLHQQLPRQQLCK